MWACALCRFCFQAMLCFHWLKTLFFVLFLGRTAVKKKLSNPIKLFKSQKSDYAYLKIRYRRRKTHVIHHLFEHSGEMIMSVRAFLRRTRLTHTKILLKPVALSCQLYNPPLCNIVFLCFRFFHLVRFLYYHVLKGFSCTFHQIKRNIVSDII